MKRFFTTCFFLTLFGWTASAFYPRDPGAKYPIDTCKLLVTYDFAFVTDTLNNKICRDRTWLEIGSHTNRYYSALADMLDSMSYNYFVAIPRGDFARLEGGINPWNYLRKNDSPWLYDVYTHPQQQTRMISQRFRDIEYRYEEPAEAFDWRITEQADTVIGYVCRKAVGTFRGRTWEVWFAPDIPIASGPWKFFGLPGLILKATDLQRLYCWSAVGIERPNDRHIHDYADKALNGVNRDPLVIPSHKKVACRRQDLEPLSRRYWLAPLTIMFLDGQEHVVYDMSTQKTVKVDINDVPNGYYPRLELE